MLEIKIECLGKFDKETIIRIAQNNFLFFKTEEKKNIVGFFTDSLATCASIIISFNEDDYIFFSHIDEKSNLLGVIKEISKNRLPNNIKKIDINYSKGKNSLKNDKISYDSLISNIIDILRESIDNKDLVINKSFKEHSSITSCLKIFKNSCFQKIINCQNTYFNKKNNDNINEEIKKHYGNAQKIYSENMDNNHYIIYYYTQKNLKKF